MAHNRREESSLPTTPPAPDNDSGVPAPARAHPAAMLPPDSEVHHKTSPSGWSVATWSWLQTNTFIPTWLPKRWRHPVADYVLAMLVQVAVAVITRLLIQFVPTYAFPSVLEILAVALIAMTWGAGPGVFAALVGLALEETFVLTAFHGEGHLTGGDVVEGVVFMAVGICLSLVASMTERSRRRAMEEQAAAEARAAEAREAALRQTQEQMDEFVAIASHDLRSPLAAARGFNDIAASRYERLSAAVAGTRPDLARQVEAVRTSMQETGQQVERLARLVDLLFDTTRMRAGKIELRRQPCDLTAVVRNQIVALRIANPHGTLHLEEPHECLVTIVADADRIGQVVTNYVTNALKYSPMDQPVTVRVGHDETWARVSVKDHGPGLPASEQEHIWERFYRVTNGRTPRESGAGLGLGLYICKAIIEGHGGKVGVQSEVGTGSTFWFAVPLADEISGTGA